MEVVAGIAIAVGFGAIYFGVIYALNQIIKIEKSQNEVISKAVDVLKKLNENTELLLNVDKGTLESIKKLAKITEESHKYLNNKIEKVEKKND